MEKIVTTATATAAAAAAAATSSFNWPILGSYSSPGNADSPKLVSGGSFLKEYWSEMFYRLDLWRTFLLPRYSAGQILKQILVTKSLC